ncbi:Ig-like domain-containing protein, partial [Neomoorella thermoacetica]
MTFKRLVLVVAAVMMLLLGATSAYAAYTINLNEPVVSTSAPPYATVTAGGSVQADGQPAVGVPVALRLSGADGQLLAADQVATDSSGSFSEPLPLPAGTNSGSATLVAAAAGAIAQQVVEIPPLPAAYYGSVKNSGGSNVAAGSVEAYIDGQKVGSLDFQNGFYGGSGGLDPKLVASGTDADKGKTVTFKVVINGQAYDATPASPVTWEPGDVRQVDLSITAQQPPAGDQVPPAVTTTDPANGATGVAVTKAVAITFSENIQAGAAYDSIALKDGSGNSVAFTKSISGSVLTITPSANLAYSTIYTVSLPAAAVQDLAGNALASPFTFSFTTQAASSGGGGGGG